MRWWLIVGQALATLHVHCLHSSSTIRKGSTEVVKVNLNHKNAFNWVSCCICPWFHKYPLFLKKSLALLCSMTWRDVNPGMTSLYCWSIHYSWLLGQPLIGCFTFCMLGLAMYVYKGNAPALYEDFRRFNGLIKKTTTYSLTATYLAAYPKFQRITKRYKQ